MESCQYRTRLFRTDLFDSYSGISSFDSEVSMTGILNQLWEEKLSFNTLGVNSGHHKNKQCFHHMRLYCQQD